MILEHRSNKLPREGATLDPNRIGENPITQRDLKESKIPRSYFTVRGRKVEHHFEGMPVYAAHVPDEHVYDAHKDPEGLVDKWAGRGWHVDHLINNVKAAGYKGIKWQDGATVAMFHPVAVTPTDPIPKEKRHRTEMLRHFVAGYKRLGGTDVRKAIAAFKAHPKFSSWFDANEAGREAVQLARESSNRQKVYHITSRSNLEGIRANGLVPRGGTGIGGGGVLADHSAKGVFVTTAPDQVRRWHGQTEDPVVLRAHIGEREVYKDARAWEGPNYFVKGTVAPEHIEVYHGGQWHPIASAPGVSGTHRVPTLPEPEHEASLLEPRLHAAFGEWVKDLSPEQRAKAKEMFPHLQLARYQAPAEGAVVNNGFAKGGQFMSAPRASVRDVMRRLRMMKGPVKLARDGEWDYGDGFRLPPDYNDPAPPKKPKKPKKRELPTVPDNRIPPAKSWNAAHLHGIDTTQKHNGHGWITPQGHYLPNYQPVGEHRGTWLNYAHMFGAGHDDPISAGWLHVSERGRTQGPEYTENHLHVWHPDASKITPAQMQTAKTLGRHLPQFTHLTVESGAVGNGGAGHIYAGEKTKDYQNPDKVGKAARAKPIKLARIEHPTFAGLVERIHQRPHDQLGYLILSDYMEEEGHEKEAGLLRKIVHHGGVNDVVTLHAQPSGNHYPLPDYGYGFSAHRAGPGIHPMTRSMIGQSHTQSPRPGAVIHGGGDKSLFLPLHPPYDAKDDQPF